MLRRLVLAPAVAFLAIGTAVTPADAGRLLCVSVALTEQFDLPNWVPGPPENVCVPVLVDPPAPVPAVDLPPIG
ncbi:MAG TPA: hypothetical protein VGX28_01885 [Frankiaceae bacterium]|jgi:hypothetical protein|nr:hypothetical protein [Frankiaceae bacterium]